MSPEQIREALKQSECWCDEEHDYTTTDPRKVARNIWHLLIIDLRIPQLVDWLAKRLSKR